MATKKTKKKVDPLAEYRKLAAAYKKVHGKRPPKGVGVDDLKKMNLKPAKKTSKKRKTVAKKAVAVSDWQGVFSEDWA